MNERKDWDLIILTVGSTLQQTVSERLLYACASRFAREVRILPDGEMGRRIGSGGAVLRALSTLSDKPQKVLIINSGGMSKRAIHYAVRGKAFADVQYKGRQTTLLELILMQCSFLAPQISSGVLISCSDICVMTQNCTAPFDENIGFCVRTDVETGTRHGVMFGDAHGRLTDYLHKQSAERLRAFASGQDVAVDTGMIFLQDTLVSALQSAAREPVLCEAMQTDGMELNFYEDIVYLLSANKDKQAYLRDASSPIHLAIRKMLWDRLQDFSLRICTVDSSEFLHFGTLEESRHNILALAEQETVQINTSVDDRTMLGSGTVLTNVQLQNCTVGKNCMLNDISLHDTAVADDLSVCGIRLQEGACVAIVCPITENPKLPHNGIPLWETPRFYKGKNFQESYEKWLRQSNEPTYSLAFCTENADSSYPSDWAQYLRDMALYREDTLYSSYRKNTLSAFYKTYKPLSHLIFAKKKSRICLPVRINLSGTWTDALPYCIDHGGEVINAAVTVQDVLPVQVEVERLEEPILLLQDEDASVQFTADEWRQTPRMTDLGRFNLHLAALEIFGISADTALTGGLRLSTSVVGLAPGSGLGISSILLSGCFLALDRLFGKGLSYDDIFRMVFVAEQKMQTGGGWQDQVGGIIPGVKRTASRPGYSQALSVQTIPLLPRLSALFADRLCLLHTGKRHFGRFIVNDVMHRYLSGDAATVSGLDALKALNREMADCIAQDREDGFTSCLNRHWSILKTLSPLITNEDMEHMALLCESVCSAVSICGAGGGGYFLVCLREGKTAEDLRRLVCAHLPHLSAECVKSITLWNQSHFISEEETTQ
ncbi:MAG: L-fucokinase [Acutalibacteraceae bacterium]